MVLSIKLPQEWANKEVNVLLVLEALQNSLKQPEPANLTQAFELLTQLTILWLFVCQNVATTHSLFPAKLYSNPFKILFLLF